MSSIVLVALALLAALPVRMQGQARDTAIAPILTLDDAISLARRNNPEHLQVVNTRRSAGAALRSAYGALLPRADAELQGQYRKEGVRPINGVEFDTQSDIYQSSYWLGLSYSLNGAKLIDPRLQSANLDAVEAEISSSATSVRAEVTQRYLTVLQSEARTALQDSLVATAEAQLELARAKLAVGSGTQLDVSRAEVTLGQSRVEAVRARNQVEIDKLRLFQQMGVPQPANVRLTSRFDVSQPSFTLDSVLGVARAQNPALDAIRSRDKVAALGVRRARSEYLPTLSLSTGLGGYTYEVTDGNVLVEQARAQAVQRRASCYMQDSLRVGAGLPSIQDQCNLIGFTDAEAAAIRSANDQFPFDFARQPLSVSASLSLPIFDGLAREQRVQEAQADRNDVRYQLRARELQLTADVTQAYLTLTTQARVVALQEQNAAKAREELRLAEERYRVGASTFLEVTEARASVERAENERITAVYDYHKAFAALESAVGQPLR
jgi:outer membrane protein